MTRTWTAGLCAVVACWATNAFAEERALTGDEIRALLPTIVSLGDDTRQTFESYGHTDYLSGDRPSAGRWRVQDDRYCSEWPPADGWSCWAVHIDETPEDGDGPVLIWIGSGGSRDVTRIEPRTDLEDAQ